MLSQPVELHFVAALTPIGSLKAFWNALCEGGVTPRASLTSLPFHAEEREMLEPAFLYRFFRQRRMEANVQANRRALRVREFFATTKGLPRKSPVQPLFAAVMDTPSTIISNACVSGAQAIIEAAEAIADGDCGLATVYAGDAITEFIESGFRALQAVASDVARPFDHKRDGLSLGTAAATVWLRTPETQSKDARIISYGCSNDANHISGPSRDGSGLALAIERALDGIDRSEIRAICAHGTATEYNDAMEARAFHKVFGGHPPPVFGIKGAIGHTLGAAGLIEVIVSALVATQGLIPPTVGFEQGDEDFPLDVVHGEPRKMEPGYVLTTNSGFGGMNTAIVIGPGKR
jgi:3-oxoacyl-(acyl-carrier-protein) synthase